MFVPGEPATGEQVLSRQNLERQVVTWRRRIQQACDGDRPGGKQPQAQQPRISRRDSLIEGTASSCRAVDSMGGPASAESCLAFPPRSSRLVLLSSRPPEASTIARVSCLRITECRFTDWRRGHSEDWPHHALDCDAFDGIRREAVARHAHSVVSCRTCDGKAVRREHSQPTHLCTVAICGKPQGRRRARASVSLATLAASSRRSAFDGPALTPPA
jgi:hypothetical protein